MLVGVVSRNIPGAGENNGCAFAYAAAAPKTQEPKVCVDCKRVVAEWPTSRCHKCGDDLAAGW